MSGLGSAGPLGSASETRPSSLSASDRDPSVTCSRPPRPAPACSGQKPTKRRGQSGFGSACSREAPAGAEQRKADEGNGAKGPRRRGPRSGRGNAAPPRRAPRAGLASQVDAAPAGTPPGRRRDRRAQTRGLEPQPLAAGPRSAFSAHSGPPLGRFRFRFLAESVEENESGSVQSLRGSGRGEGRTVRGAQPGAGEPEPQPAPGKMAVGPGLPCTAGSDEAGQQTRKWTPSS
ncbi:unnamed protein product [Rangifer tarandus platyrhynchus]|uniref:Uncharacterized protein n=1 Tax=Rangifer tarandus platyrhynchus TaxID=3082113 RepID=A0ABN8Z8K2_RANTA|nr:unnamed protein product [Rangifer tarandus platyrhynchus]